MHGPATGCGRGCVGGDMGHVLPGQMLGREGCVGGDMRHVLPGQMLGREA